ncbi:MAG TPA: ribosome maturation factor [Saprospiraceae bacterium]|nr:ribosome maturation factor [Saprospiraceae bacterium]
MYYICTDFDRKGTESSLFCFLNLDRYSENIANLLLEKFQEEKYQDCFLVDIETGPKKVSVYVDSDSMINFEKCQELSRYLEAVLDEKKWFGEDYVLEVSSPGLSRPLKFLRQYQKNIGRTLKVKNSEDQVMEGQLIKATEQSIILSKEEKVKEGKKNIKVVIEQEIPFGLIKEAKVQVQF